MHFFRKNYSLILLLFLSLWAVKSFFTPGFFPIHDNTQVARVYEMGKVLRDGVFPVRWVPDLGYGYGYPIFNFYAPLAYYIGGLFILLGFDALLATKIMMALGVVLAGIFMYLLAREFWGELGGIISGLFYVYAPYHALDIYVRGDVAEFWAYAFIPLAFLGIYKKNILIGSIGLAAIILSHNLTAMMVTPFLFIAVLLNCYIAFHKKQFSSLIFHFSPLILGLALSAFYWIPALLEMKYTNVLSQIGGGADFKDHFICLNQLWNSPWGFGGSTKGCIDGMSFMIGKLHVIISAIGLILSFFLLAKNKNYNGYKSSTFFSRSIGLVRLRSVEKVLDKHYIIFPSLAGFILSIFLTLELSKPIWEAIQLMAFFQYPWRFLILASFFSSFLSGFAIWFLKKTTIRNYSNTLMYCSGIILVFLLLFFNSKFFLPQTIFRADAEDFTNEIALKWTASKISDEYLPSDFKKPKSEKEIAKWPAIQPKETEVEKAANIISLVAVLGLVIGIIKVKGKLV